MAHADYACCAVCDAKMHYAGSDAPTKEGICSECLKDLRTRGANVYVAEDLLDWMHIEEPKKVVEVLTECRFSTCHYRNDVDEKWEQLLEEVARIVGDTVEEVTDDTER